MLYKEIIKMLIKRKQMTQDEFAKKLGMQDQRSLSSRLNSAWNPGMKDVEEMLDKLGYEIAFLPKGTVEDSKSLSEIAFVPEFEERKPWSSKAKKFSEK